MVSVMSQQLCLLVLGLGSVYCQVQYYENNTVVLPIWHLFATRKPEWVNWTAPTTTEALDWIQFHTRQSIWNIELAKKSSTTPRSKVPTTPYPLFSFNTDRLFNLSWEADALKKRLDYEYELEANLSITTEPTIDPSYIPPSPRIFNVYKGVYINDSSFENLYWNKSYYERFNRSINWAKKKSWWMKTPKTSTTEWPYINITKIGDWDRLSFELDDLSYWDSERQKEEYAHHDYMQAIKAMNRTPTTEQVTPLIKLLANTRVASLWMLHSVLPYLRSSTTFRMAEDHELRDAIYEEDFPVSPVIHLEHDTGPTEYYAMANEYDYRDLSQNIGPRAREQEYTKLWDERYYQQHYPPGVTEAYTRRLEYPTRPDPLQEWNMMDTWKRREYILRGWNTIKFDFEQTRAVPHVFTPHPNPTTFDFYDYQDYTPLADYFDKMVQETTRINSREVSLIIWSEKQAVETTTKPSSTLAPGETPQRRPKKRKVWTTAKVKPGHKNAKKLNRTMSQQEIKRMMREKYKKLAEDKEQKKKDKAHDEAVDARFKDLEAEGFDPTRAYIGDDTTLPYVPPEFDEDDELILPSTKVPIKEYQCHICLKQLTSKGGFLRHINTHKRMGQWVDPF
uniref:C2H2-type domain-containing protein n=1 Tax=Cacopsylla melanoneura TaxID=428564 RepID=A0A8D8V090_9HEMI